MTPEQAAEVLQRLTRIETQGEAQARDIARVEAKVDRLAQQRDADRDEELHDQRWRRVKAVAAPVGGGGVGAALLWIAQQVFGGK